MRLSRVTRTGKAYTRGPYKKRRITRNHIQLLLARDAGLALEGCGMVCGAWPNIEVIWNTQ